MFSLPAMEQATAKVQRLTARERMVAEMMADGVTNEEIRKALRISEHRFIVLRNNVYGKLNIGGIANHKRRTLRTILRMDAEQLAEPVDVADPARPKPEQDPYKMDAEQRFWWVWVAYMDEQCRRETAEAKLRRRHDA